MRNLHFQLRVGWRSEWEEKLGAHLQQKIRDARVEKGLSQRELARQLERSNAYVSQLESGRLEAAVIDLVGICFALDKPLQYFLPMEDAHEHKPVGQDWELLNQFRKISDDAVRDAAIRQVAALAKLEKKSKGTRRKPNPHRREMPRSG